MFSRRDLLFAQNARRGVVSQVVYELDEEPAPDCIIPELFGVNVVESCAITTEVDPSLWIRTFIEKFEAAERGTNIIRAVTLTYRRDGKAWSLGQAVGTLGEPRCVDVPTPHNAFVNKCFRCIAGFTVTESPVAELYVFDSIRACVQAFRFFDREALEGLQMHSSYLRDVVNRHARSLPLRRERNLLREGYSTTELAVTELYEFENPTSAKKLEIFKWTVEEVCDEDSSYTELHYAFLLQVIDI